jgi:hypothetical protein
MNKCDAISDNMIAYKNLYYYLEGTFDGCEVSHISRASNEEADNLANIGSQYLPVPQGVFWEDIIERSIKSNKTLTTEEQGQHQATGSGDEDIPSIDTPAVPTAEHIQGPITRARAKQLNYQVLSFLGTLSHIHENMMLPKSDMFVTLRNDRPSMDEGDKHWSMIVHGDGSKR